MRLLACDFDGTVFRNETVAPRDLQAIAAWRRAGNLFGIVTGRGARTLLADLDRLPLEYDFLLCNNGALLLDERARFVAAQNLGAHLARQLLAHEAAQACTSCALFSGTDMHLLEGRGPWLNRVYTASFISRESALSRELLQISFGFADRSVSLLWGKRLQEELAGLAKVQCSLSVADVTSLAAGKARGIAFALETLHLAPEHVLVAGDDGNDVEMLQAYEGYAMQDAAQEVQEAAGRTVASVADIVEKS